MVYKNHLLAIVFSCNGLNWAQGLLFSVKRHEAPEFNVNTRKCSWERKHKTHLSLYEPYRKEIVNNWKIYKRELKFRFPSYELFPHKGRWGACHHIFYYTTWDDVECSSAMQCQLVGKLGHHYLALQLLLQLRSFSLKSVSQSCWQVLMCTAGLDDSGVGLEILFVRISNHIL